MRPRRSWLSMLATWLLLLFTIGYVSAAVFGPRWIREQLHRTVGDALTVGTIRLGFPCHLVLCDVNLASTTTGAVTGIRRIRLHPGGLSWSRKTLWIKALVVEGPRVSLRRTDQGTLIGPTLASVALPPSAKPTIPSHDVWSGWRIVIQTVDLSNGLVEFVDQSAPRPFRGALAHLSLVGGPLTIPLQATPVAMAIQAQVVGDQQHSAPLYCSGWVDVEGANLDTSCQLEPLRLAAFAPYYQQRPLPLRIYDATIQATGRVLAKANVLEGRMQLEIGNLADADLAFLGWAVADIKKLTAASSHALTGEIEMSGPLEQPQAWNFQFTPGDEAVRRLMQWLFSRGVEVIPIKVGEQVINVELAPATKESMVNAEATSKTVQESLQMIAPTSQPPETPKGEAPSPAAPAASQESTEAPASPTVAPTQPPVAPTPSQPQEPTRPVPPIEESPGQASPTTAPTVAQPDGIR